MKVRVVKPFKNNDTNEMTKIGDILEVSEERYLIMDKHQKGYGEKYIEPLVEEKVIEKAVVEEKAEKPVEKAVVTKKTTKKKK